jgi:hypothetical protein
VSVYDGFSTVNGNVNVTVHQLPVPDAGPDKTIAVGTSTMLEGSASLGSGSYLFHWEPADSLVNPNVAQPTTTLLHATTLYSLSVTDAQTGCVCSASDNVTVVVTGNALNVNPLAQPDTICSGESVQLYSLAGGGSGFYEYYWTSVPAGYTSTEVNPVVEPIVSTVYSVSITDGYTYVSGTANVVVNPAPVINLGPDATVCVFDTLTLDAGNPGSSYVWSNGSTQQIITLATTGIGFDFKTISVTVTTPDGCTAFDERTIIFDFAACNSIDDPFSENGFHIYPNPGNGIIHIENNAGIENCLLSVNDIFGREVIKNHEIHFSDAAGTFYLDLASYPPGLYLIRISENGNDMASIKYLLKR